MPMRSEYVDQMSIGEFARRSRLSAKALRLYDELGLLLPARVDEDSAYRFYEPGQLKQARLIAALRELQVPLADIKVILALEPVRAAERVRQFWAATEAGHTTRRALATYLIDELSGKRSVLHEVSTRDIPERAAAVPQTQRQRLGSGVGVRQGVHRPASALSDAVDGGARRRVFLHLTGVRSARTATVRWSGAVPSHQTRRKRSPPAARS